MGYLGCSYLCSTPLHECLVYPLLFLLLFCFLLRPALLLHKNPVDPGLVSLSLSLSLSLRQEGVGRKKQKLGGGVDKAPVGHFFYFTSCQFFLLCYGNWDGILKEDPTFVWGGGVEEEGRSRGKERNIKEIFYISIISDDVLTPTYPILSTLSIYT